MSKKLKNPEPAHSKPHDSHAHELENHISDSSHTKTHDSRSISGGDHQEGYQFAIAGGGVVTSITEVEHGIAKIKSIKPYQTYSVSGADVLKTESKGGFQEISRYSDSNTDGLYQKIAEATVLDVGAATPTLQNALLRGDHMKFSFDASGQVVLGAYHVMKNGLAINETIKANTQFSVQNGFVIETESKGTTTHWEIFRDGNADGIYSEVAHGEGLLIDLVGLSNNLAPVAHLL
ncbi:MAG: hypothetical protein WC073_07315 [Sterolibacterium sp.]